MKLTEAELKRAMKLAEKGRRPLSGIEIVALRASNRVEANFRPLVETLTNNQKKRLQKVVRDGK